LGPWVLLAYVGFLINLTVTEFDMIDMINDPNEIEQDVLEEIDPDLVSYTLSTRDGDQLIYLNKVYQIKKKLPTAAGPFRIQW
jgi:hypothetical protein